MGGTRVRDGAWGRVIDHCLLCSAPVHEAETSVHFVGLYVHLPCYRREMKFPDPETNRRSAAT
jgi:hypothetical protein